MQQFFLFEQFVGEEQVGPSGVGLDLPGTHLPEKLLRVGPYLAQTPPLDVLLDLDPIFSISFQEFLEEISLGFGPPACAFSPLGVVASLFGHVVSLWVCL